VRRAAGGTSLAQAEPHLRPSTLHSYRDHIDRHLIPSLGRITLGDLTGKRPQAPCRRSPVTNGSLFSPTGTLVKTGEFQTHYFDLQPGRPHLASVVDPSTGHVLPPLAQVALEEGETVARNLDAELRGSPLEAFTFHGKGFVVSVGTRRGVAEIAGVTSGGRLAHLLKDAIEWEYRQSVRHLRGWDPVAR
jgi:Phage integrase, N-terminal SAM-like domain